MSEPHQSQPNEHRLGQLARLREAWLENRSTRQFVQIAEELRRLGDAAGAADLLEAGLEAHPRYLSAQVALARCRLELQEAVAARGLLERVVETDSTHPLATKLLIEAYVAVGESEAARGKLELYRLLNAGDPSIEELEAEVVRLEGGRAIGVADGPAVPTLEEERPTSGVGAEEAGGDPGGSGSRPPSGAEAVRHTDLMPPFRLPPAGGRSAALAWNRARDLAVPFDRIEASRGVVARSAAPANEGALVAPFALTPADVKAPEPGRSAIAAGLGSDSVAQEAQLEAPAGAEWLPVETNSDWLERAPAKAEDLASALVDSAEPEAAEAVAEALEPVGTPLVESAPSEEEAAEVEAEVEIEPVELSVAERAETDSADLALPLVLEPLDDEPPAEDEPKQVEEQARPLAIPPEVALVASEAATVSPVFPRDDSPVPAETTTLGLLYLRQGHSGEAERIFRRVLAREPANDIARDGLRRAMIESDLARGGSGSGSARGVTERKVQRLTGWLGRIRKR